MDVSKLNKEKKYKKLAKMMTVMKNYLKETSFKKQLKRVKKFNKKYNQ